MTAVIMDPELQHTGYVVDDQGAILGRIVELSDGRCGAVIETDDGNVWTTHESREDALRRFDALVPVVVDGRWLVETVAIVVGAMLIFSLPMLLEVIR